MFQTLPGSVSCFRGQNPFVLYRRVRRSGLYCRPDPTVLPTGSVFRIFTTRPEESLTSATPGTPGGRRVIIIWITESSVQRSAVFRWKPGIRIAASSYSALRHRRMSGVVPSPVSAFRSRSDDEYCSEVISLPRSDCVIQLLPLHYQLDGYPYDLMMEFVGD